MKVFVAYKEVIASGNGPIIGVFKSLDDAREAVERVNSELYYDKFNWNDTKLDMLNFYDSSSKLSIREFEIQ